MKVGILAEYNPFHNGHQKQIDYIRRNYPDATIIVVSSGDLVLRGDISMINKFERSKAAADNGVDIFFSMNPESSLNSAKEFARQGIRHLINLGAEMIVFGSELGDKKSLTEYAKLIIEKKEDINALKKEGLTLPKIIENILEFKLKSNDILAIEYIIQIIENGYNIKYDVIKRLHENNICSATKIREMVKNGNLDYNNFTNIDLGILNIRSIDDYTDLLKHYLATYENQEEKREMNKITMFLKRKQFNSITSLSTNSTKNFTEAKIRRSIMKIIFNIDASNQNYIRLLSSSEKGLLHLKNIDKSFYYSKFKKDLMKSDMKVSEVISIFDKDYSEIEKNWKVYIK